MAEENRPPDEQIPAPQDSEEEIIDVTFLDRVIAFLALIYPFSLLIDKGQELLQDRIATTIRNMLVLVGIIVFLLLVNRVAKLVYALRHRK